MAKTTTERASWRWDAGRGADLADLITAMQAAYPIDPARVYVMGRSNGGEMSYRMACDHADLVTAIASFAGATFLDEADCLASGPVSVLEIHGTADDVVPYEDGLARTLLPEPGALTTVTRWATRAGCDLEAATDGTPFDYDTSVPGDEATPRVWSTGCAPGIGVELWTLDGGGHYPTLADDATTRIFDFLLAHHR